MSLRVLLVGPYPPPFGGVASHLVNLIPGLVARGAEDVCVVSFGNATGRDQKNGATIYRVNARTAAPRALVRRPRITTQTLASLLGWRLGPAGLAREAVKASVIAHVAMVHRSNVVAFYQSNLSLPLLPLRRLWGSRVGVILTVLGGIYDAPDFFEPRRARVGELLAAADARLSSSLHCARSFQELGLHHEIEAVYWGVDLDRFVNDSGGGTFRVQHGVAPTDTMVVFMGRFSEDMGLDAVLEVIPGLLASDSTLKFVLAGSRGPIEEAAASIARDHAGRVVILNNVPFSVQPALYAAADIVLAPTRDQHACMGMSIKEAMAAARPVIGSDAGGIPEAIVDGVTGVLVPLGGDRRIDLRRLVEAIGTLAGDCAIRESMGRAARARAEAIFANEKTVDRIFAVMSAICPDSAA